jgi:MipA family protein
MPHASPFAPLTASLAAALLVAGAAAGQESVAPGLLTGALDALDAPNPDVVISLRGGVEVSPAYFGSDDYQFGPDVAVRLDYLRLPYGIEFGSARTVGFTTGWSLQGSARYIPERDSDDYAQLDGLDDVDWSFELGMGVGYNQRNYRLFGVARYGVIGHNAWVAELGADGIAYPVEGLTLTLGPRLEFGDRKFNDTYFGVSSEEAANSSLPEYEPGSGLYLAGVELGARYLFNERWGLEGAAGWGRLMNDAGDSPITEEGSADQYRVRVGVTRRISLDF